MSTVLLILIKNKKLRIANAHYTTIKKMIENEEFYFETLKEKTSEIDAGYVLIDCDAGIMLNAQNAFAVHNTRFTELLV